MIGRSRELGILAKILSGQAEQSCAAVVGESGIGKTTLLETAIAEVPASTTVQWVSGRELQQLVPYAALDALFDIDAMQPNGGDPYGHVLGVTTRLTDHLAQQRPAVLCVDDAHWLDDVTLTVLDRLVDRLPDADARLLIGSRPTGRRIVVGVIEHVEEIGVSIELRPFAGDEMDRLVVSKLGRSPGPVLRELVRGASGNPFLVNELIDVLLATDALHDDPDGNVEPRDARIPRTLSTMVAGRVEQLLPEARQLLAVLAALGGDATVSTLTEVLDAEPMQLADRLGAAERQGLIQQSEGGVRFRHDLIRRALADEIDPALVRSVQLDAASAETDPATAAAYVTEAGPPYTAQHIEILVRAADEVLARDADRATELLALALEHGDDGAAQAELRERQLRSLLRAGRLGDVMAPLLQLPAATGDRTLALGLLDAQANQDQPDPDLVDSVLDHTLQTATTARPEALGHLAYFAVRADAERFRDWLLSLPPPDDSWPTDARSHGWIASATLAGLDADLEGAAGLARRALATASDGRASPATMVRAGLTFGVFGGDLAEFRDDAIEVLNETTRIAERHGLVGLIPAAHALLANAHWAAGNWADADAGYRSAEAAARDADVPRWTAEAHTGLCHMMADRGDSDAALSHLAACEAAGERYERWVGRRGWSPGGTGRGWMSHDALRARIAFGRDDDTEAIRSWTADLRDPKAPRFAKAISAMDLTVCALGANDRSTITLAAATLQSLPSEGLPMSLVQPLVVAADRRDLDAAIGAEEVAAIGPAYGIAKAAEIVGLLARDLGRADVAVTRLEHARSVWEVCGADALAARDATWLDALGARVTQQRTPRPVTGWESLSDAESRVVHLVATGALYREVADQLHVSRRTVETHAANAMRKLQVRNRGELTAAYWRHHASED